MSENVVDSIVDFANALEAATTKLKMSISPKPEENQKWTWNPEAIVWQKAHGSKGEFERADDKNNHDFQALQKDLADHGGKLTRDSYFYWAFTKGEIVGRKQRS